jgi:serine/threonine protein kinase
MSQGAPAESVTTWKVGRYDVVGHLASGGMAEILLGRILGPSGFQRPVVIKRILPHLAREAGFVGMFLDEARIVAGIRHPNVVQVHELGHEADNLFLVMEFLEGESCSGLAKRLRSQDETLDYALAAYIIAEACAGLHAAHELKDPNGSFQNVVHRDVSPQNVFVTYAGQVKVLDFGIATAADRVTRTETGTFKGKFEYSSPEQCKGRPLDRRSDVFALGVLLFELSTGTRLFKRAGQLDTLRAICEEPIISPKDVRPDYPDVLISVLLRALERDKEKRYPTALAMRHDLLAAVRQLTTEVALEESMSRVMHRIFADRIAEKSTLLRRVESGSNVEEIPAVETDTSIEIPLAVDTRSVPPPNDRTAPLPVYTPSGGIPVPPDLGLEPTFGLPKRPPWLPILGGAGAGVLILGVLGVWLATRNQPSDVPTVPTAGADPSASVSAAVAAPSISAAPEPPVTAAAVTDVVIHVETVPSKAHVLIGGEDRGLSPVDIRLPKSSDALDLELRHDGYQSTHDKITPDADQKLKLTLAPAAGAAPRTTPAASAATNPYKRFD